MGSLLEVGTGFHPELTGRENIYLNGADPGHAPGARSTASFDEIVAFAELGAFLDTPVKRYSSGMYVRLAFAVAAHLEPEILIVDEVLAVGDVAFQRKCLGKMGEVERQGRTVLFVRHNMAAVEHLCRTGLILQHGRLVFRGSVPDAIGHYLRTATGGDDDVRSHIIDLGGARTRKPGSPVLLRRLELRTVDGKPLDGGLGVGAPFEARVGLVLERPAVSLELIIRFHNMLGQRILVANSSFDPAFAGEERSGAQTVVCRIPSLTLMPGEYRLRVALYLGGVEVDAVDHATSLTVVPSDYYGSGRLPQSGAFVLPQSWSVASESPNHCHRQWGHANHSAECVASAPLLFHPVNGSRGRWVFAGRCRSATRSTRIACSVTRTSPASSSPRRTIPGGDGPVR